MATPTRKPLSSTTNVSPRRPGLDSSPARPPSSSPVPSTTGQGLARTPSVRQARPVRRSTARMSTSFTPDGETSEDEKATASQLIADLKESVARAEAASEHYRKQLEIMQKRLDESTNEQTIAEERDFQRQTQLDRLQAEMKEASRLHRESDLAHESEKRMLSQDRERLAGKEVELQATIGRLNETLRNKGLERAANRAASIPVPESNDESANIQSGDPAADTRHQRDLEERDTTIESLRLELADFHLKAAEQEHMGDSNLQMLEKQVTEYKMQNARLQEENESFEMLLSEKTLKGDFLAGSRETAGMSTLEEELESVNDDPDMQTDVYKKLEAELKASKEENKGLSLYIDKIIGRILQHEGFEHLVLNNKDEASMPPPPPPNKPAPIKTEKALPATPGDDIQTPSSAATVTNAATGFLKRAGSLMSRTGNPSSRPARPMSMAQAPPTANENPETAPSIPLNRGHRRARSDQAQQDLQLGAAAVVQQMNRGSPLRTVSGGPMSPGISPLSPSLQPKTGYFPGAGPQAQRAPSAPTLPNQGQGSSRNSIQSDHSIERSSTEASSLPPAGNVPSNAPSGPGSAIPGAVMKQNQLRPLRLVQEKSREEEEAQKRLNRGSWMGWFKGSAMEANQDDHGIDR